MAAPRTPAARCSAHARDGWRGGGSGSGGGAASGGHMRDFSPTQGNSSADGVGCTKHKGGVRRVDVRALTGVACQLRGMSAPGGGTCPPVRPWSGWCRGGHIRRWLLRSGRVGGVMAACHTHCRRSPGPGCATSRRCPPPGRPWCLRPGRWRATERVLRRGGLLSSRAPRCKLAGRHCSW